MPPSLPWPNCLNVRDLGGTPTVEGLTVQPGRLIRSDNLTRLSDEGVRAVRAHGVGLIIDVRSSYEVEGDANPFQDGHEGEVAYVNLPLIDADAPELSLPATLDDMYRWNLDYYGDSMVRILRAFAAAPAGPVAVHCHSGKDRTGLITAVLLSLAGVSAHTIADDYAQSGAHLRDSFAEMLAHADEADREQLAEELTSRPETMVAAIQYLESQHGGIGHYLRSLGVEPDLVAAIRRRLLTPP